MPFRFLGPGGSKKPPTIETAREHNHGQAGGSHPHRGSPARWPGGQQRCLNYALL